MRNYLNGDTSLYNQEFIDYYMAYNGILWNRDLSIGSPDCKKLELEKLNIHIGSQNDKKFLFDFASKIKSLDIIIDDGGHTMEQQINTFEILFPIFSSRETTGS